MKLSQAEKELHQETVKELEGSAKRLYMARVAKILGRGGPSLLKRELGWNRETIRKGSRELKSGILPQTNALYLFFVTGPVTADCLVDCIAQLG